ncbi:MAG TPA: hypothetical protein VH105_25190, partial [Burkholderiales bacterium]|nr:hypothetical protein [Burkholderiales bacterium]
MNQDTLSKVADTLNKDGWNYTVFLRTFTAPFSLGTSSEQLIRNALGTNVTIAGLKQVSLSEVLSEIEPSISYAGDRSAGPDSEVIESKEFSELLSNFFAEISIAAKMATLIEKFSIDKGHPA